jgi:translocation and assembly module TamB
VSDLEKKLTAEKARLEAKLAANVARVKRSLGTRVGRGIAWTVLGLLSLVIVLFLGFAWYSTTGDFEQRVGKKVVSVLEDATGPVASGD